MFNRRIEAPKGNGEILFANALIENLRYGLISLDIMFKRKIPKVFGGDKHTFYFFYMQSLLAAQGNIWNILYGDHFRAGREQSETRRAILRTRFDINTDQYRRLKDKRFRNTNAHFDERYEEHGFRLGDLNIIDRFTEDSVKKEIINTTHLRTIDIENWVYRTYYQGKPITLDLRELKEEMMDLLGKLAPYDIRRGEER